MTENTADLTIHPDLGLAVAPLRAQNDLLSEVVHHQRVTTAKWRNQLASTSAEKQSLAADNIALSAKLDLLYQQINDKEIQQQNDALRKQCDDLLKLRDSLTACLQEKTDEIRMAEDIYREDMQDQLTKLQDVRAELQKLRVKYENEKAHRAEDEEKAEVCKQNLRELHATHQATVAELKATVSLHLTTVGQLKLLRDAYDKQKVPMNSQSVQESGLQAKHLATVAELNQLRSAYNNERAQYKQNKQKADACKNELIGLHATHQTTVAEMMKLRVAYDNLKQQHDQEERQAVAGLQLLMRELAKQ